MRAGRRILQCTCMTDTTGTLVTYLRDVRTHAAMTQEQLADAAGVTRQTIISIERGNYTPSVALALRLARIFNVSVEDIFAYEG